MAHRNSQVFHIKQASAPSEVSNPQPPPRGYHPSHPTHVWSKYLEIYTTLNQIKLQIEQLIRLSYLVDLKVK